MKLTQEIKQAILDGAYAMTRNGCKVRYLCNSTNPAYPLVFIIIPPKLNYHNPSKDIDTILITGDTWRATIHIKTIFTNQFLIGIQNGHPRQNLFKLF